MGIHAEVLKERRVYYLDCSYSMEKPNDIWDLVRDNLKGAIDKIADETTEIVVVPFAFDNQHHASLPVISGLASKSGKTAIKQRIDALAVNRNSMTYHSDALLDFYKNRVSDARVTYMFFMTDGQNEEKNNKFEQLLKQWGARYAGKNVYGFYVMLSKAAYNKNIDNIIDAQPHLWKVKTADININMVRLQSHGVFNARNEKSFQLPIWGDVKNMRFHASFPVGSPYRVIDTEIKNKKLVIHVAYRGNVYQLPYSKEYNVSVKMLGGGPYDFLMTETIPVKCESKPERSLKVTVR